MNRSADFDTNFYTRVNGDAMASSSFLISTKVVDHHLASIRGVLPCPRFSKSTNPSWENSYAIAELEAYYTADTVLHYTRLLPVAKVNFKSVIFMLLLFSCWFLCAWQTEAKQVDRMQILTFTPSLLPIKSTFNKWCTPSVVNVWNSQS